MFGAQTALTGLEKRFDRGLLRPVDDVVDHRPGGEVGEVEHFLRPVGVADLDEFVLLRMGVHPVDAEVDETGGRLGGTAVFVQQFRVQRQILGEVFAEDVAGGGDVGAFDPDLHIQSARAQNRRIDEVLAVRGADDDDVVELFDAVDLRQQLGHDRRLHIRGLARAAGAEERLHLVEEDHDGESGRGLLPGPSEDQTQLALGLADVLVEQLRALDVEEVGLPGPLLAGAVGQ